MKRIEQNKDKNNNNTRKNRTETCPYTNLWFLKN